MDAMHIPSGRRARRATPGPRARVVLDVFVPIREDFRALADAAAAAAD